LESKLGACRKRRKKKGGKKEKRSRKHGGNRVDGAAKKRGPHEEGASRSGIRHNTDSKKKEEQKKKGAIERVKANEGDLGKKASHGGSRPGNAPKGRKVKNPSTKKSPGER